MERVNLSWLLANVGSPYLVEFVPDSEAWADTLQTLRPTLDGWFSRQITSIGPIAWHFQGGSTAGVRVFLGDIDHPLPANFPIIQKLAPKLPVDVANILSRGYVGGYQLTLMLGIEEIVQSAPATHVAETPAQYAAEGERELLAVEWMSLGNGLPIEDFQALLTIARRLSRR